MCPEYSSKRITLKNVPINLQCENNIIILKYTKQAFGKNNLNYNGPFVGTRYLMMQRKQNVYILLNLIYVNGY